MEKNIHKIGKELFITSDEEIKDGDWTFDGENPYKWTEDDVKDCLYNPGSENYKGCKKIILTTDQDLIKDGIQAIDDTFLEWFVKNPSCEEVEVEKICNNCGDIDCIHAICHSQIARTKGDTYKIIIPKEEPNKTHYLDELSNIDKDRLAKMWEATIPRVEPKREVFLMNAHETIDTRVPKQETLNLDKLESKLDDALAKETKESLSNWLNSKRNKQETLEEFIFKVPFDYNINPKEVIDMCMKEQENIILTWRLGHFIDMINSLPDDTEKNRILKSVFDNRDGELLLESYKSMKLHYEK